MQRVLNYYVVDDQEKVQAYKRTYHIHAYICLNCKLFKGKNYTIPIELKKVKSGNANNPTTWGWLRSYR